MEPLSPWLKFYDDIPPSLDYPDKSISDAVLDTADKHPDNTALIFAGKKISYKKLAKKINSVASALLALGVRRGDTVALCLPNIPQTVYALYAINRIGAVASLIHPLSATGELKLYLTELDCNTVIALDMLYPKLEEAFADIGKRRLILTSAADELDPVSRSIYKLKNIRVTPSTNSGDNTISWHDFTASTEKSNTAPPRAPKSPSGDNIAVILFSGGTTGSPKGVMLTNLNINALAMQTAALGHLNVNGSSMLAAMPMFHGFGLGVCIHTIMFYGGTSILVPKFNADGYAKLIKKYKPNLIAGVPTLFEALLRSTKLDGTNLSFLTGVFSGGDSLKPELKRLFDSFLSQHGSRVRIREGYGTTECVTASCLTPYNIEKEGSIGIPFPDTLYKICRTGTTEDASVGTDGEICICGPTVMKGYLNNKSETDNVLKLHKDGRLWLHTGDLGMMDEDGFVYFRQRLKRVIITSGYNVYPSQIEAALCTHPAVQDCCAIGVKDPYRMQRVRVYVVPADGFKASRELKEELINHAKYYVARYAVPREVEFIESLPATKVGKVAYTELEKMANSEL